MLSAEPAILVHFKSVRIVFLVFHRVVVALFAFCACKCDFYSHNGTSRFTEIFFSFLRILRTLKKKRLPQNTRRILYFSPNIVGEKKAQYNMAHKAADRLFFPKKKNPSEVERLYHTSHQRSSVFFDYYYRLTLDKDKTPDNRLFCRHFTLSLIEIRQYSCFAQAQNSRKTARFQVRSSF